jgi:serine phosphatase RsbU (regulator of sigma subunit)
MFSGGWRDLVGGVNNVIDAFVKMTQVNENLKTENLRMGAELEVSQRIQQMVLPSSTAYRIRKWRLPDMPCIISG